MRAKTQAGITLLELMIVAAVVALIAGLSFPSVTAGLENLRMRTATDQVSGLLSEAVTRVERAEQPFILVVLRSEAKLELRSADGSFTRLLKLEDGISILHVFPELPGASGDARMVMFEPGSTVPRVGIELLSRRGQRRLVRLDPLTGMPVVETPPADVHKE
jgi:type II secretory pathway pseudopilin PulG